MEADVKVIATGNTVNLLCNEYRVEFPDGGHCTMYAVAPREPAAEMAAALAQARTLWAERRGEAR